MLEYIEREALLRTLSKEVEYDDDGEQEINSDTVFITIEGFPAADVAPVVRCRKCKNRNTAYCPLGDWTGPQDDFYCSYGALMDRKDEDNV